MRTKLLGIVSCVMIFGTPFSVEAAQGVLILKCESPTEMVRYPDGRKMPFRIPMATIGVDFNTQVLKIQRTFRYLAPYNPPENGHESGAPIAEESYPIQSTVIDPQFPQGCIQNCTAESAVVRIRLKNEGSFREDHIATIPVAKADTSDHRPVSSSFARSWTECYDSGDRGPMWSCSNDAEQWKTCQAQWR